MKVELSAIQLHYLDFALDRAMNSVETYLKEGKPEQDGYTKDEITEFNTAMEQWAALESYINENYNQAYGQQHHEAVITKFDKALKKDEDYFYGSLRGIGGARDLAEFLHRNKKLVKELMESTENINS